MDSVIDLTSDDYDSVVSSAIPGAKLENIENAADRRKKRPRDEQRASTAAKRSRTTVSEEGQLCKDCRQIDFQQVLDADVIYLQDEGEDGILIADLGNRLKNPPTAPACPLCVMLCEMQSDPLEDLFQWRNQDPTYQLRMYSYLGMCEKLHGFHYRETYEPKDMPCLRVVPACWPKSLQSGRHLLCVKEDSRRDLLFNPRITGQKASLDQVRKWREFCARHHSFCKASETQIDGLNLLDCESYEVVPAPPDAMYAALSYVWGTPPTHCEQVTMSEEGTRKSDWRMTKTIRDAAAATLDLGYKYLWVDKLCIDSNNAEEKHRQINHMDSIYACADMTIIAACGQDGHYGLPGINGTSRGAPTVVKIGGIKIVGSTPDPRSHLQHSKWNTRGWTFQESFLSRRRLVFTDDQVYFECKTMRCDENRVPNLNLIHDDKKNILACFASGDVTADRVTKKSLTKLSRLSNQGLYVDLIKKYTRRTLTFEEDRPRAFAGVMRYFTKRGIDSLWGLPCAINDPICVEHGFVHSLLWFHDKSSLKTEISMTGNVSSIDMTLKHFSMTSVPTWSWMTWRGAIDHPNMSRSFQSKVHGVRVGSEARSYTPLPELHSTISKTGHAVLLDHKNLPNVLLLDVDTVPISGISLNSLGLKVYGQNVDSYISRGPTQDKDLYKGLLTGDFSLLHLAHTVRPDQFGCGGYYLVVEARGRYFARIGLCASRINTEPNSHGNRTWVRLA